MHRIKYLTCHSKCINNNLLKGNYYTCQQNSNHTHFPSKCFFFNYNKKIKILKLFLKCLILDLSLVITLEREGYEVVHSGSLFRRINSQKSVQSFILIMNCGRGVGIVICHTFSWKFYFFKKHLD